jgi:hypothetical protein
VEAGSLWSGAEQTAAAARVLFDGGKFADARARWDAAATAYGQAAKAAEGLRAVQPTRLAYEQELAQYDAAQLAAEGGEAWGKVAAIVADAQKAAAEGRFKQAAEQYALARQSLPLATPVMRKLSVRMPKLGLFETPLSDCLVYLGDNTGLLIIVNWRMLKAAGIRREKPVSASAKDILGSDALTLVLNAAGRDARWAVIGGQFVYVSTEYGLSVGQASCQRSRARLKDPQAGALSKNLKEPLKVIFSEIPVGDGFEYFRDATGVDMAVRWGALETCGVRRETLLDIHCGKTGIPAEFALQAILLVADERLGYGLQGEKVLVVSTTEDLDTLAHP